MADPIKGSMFDLDSFTASSGLYAAGDGLDVVIPEMWVQPYKMKGDKDFGMKCVVGVRYVPEDESAGEFIDYLPVGALSIWGPSPDGETGIELPPNIDEIVTAANPEAGRQFAAPCIYNVQGKADAAFDKRSTWKFWYENAKIAGVPPPPSKSLDDYVRSGIKCHINRRAKEGAKKKDDGTLWDMVVITRFDGFVGQGSGGGSAATAAVSGAPNAGQPAAATTGADFSDLYGIVTELVAAAPNMTLAKKDLLPALLQRFAGNADGVKRAVAFANSLPALGAVPGVNFDPAAQTLKIG